MFRFTVDVEFGTIEIAGEITFEGRPATHWSPAECPDGVVTDVNLIVWDPNEEAYFDVFISRDTAADLVGPEWSRLVRNALHERAHEVLPICPVRTVQEEVVSGYGEPINDEDIPF